ncbi:MAG TPA: hypothetical protein V6C97_14380 [Oculatellaceae cyanobacterium]
MQRKKEIEKKERNTLYYLDEGSEESRKGTAAGANATLGADTTDLSLFDKEEEGEEEEKEEQERNKLHEQEEEEQQPQEHLEDKTDNREVAFFFHISRTSKNNRYEPVANRTSRPSREVTVLFNAMVIQRRNEINSKDNSDISSDKLIGPSPLDKTEV